MKTRKDVQLFSEYVYENNIDYRQFQQIYKNTTKTFFYKKTFELWIEGDYYAQVKDNKVLVFSDNHSERLCELCDEVKDNSKWTLKQYGMSFLKFCNQCLDTHEDCHADYQQKVRNIARGLPPYAGIPRPVKQPKKQVEDEALNTGLSDYIDNEDCPLRVENQMRPLKSAKPPYLKGITKSEKEARKDDAQIARRKNKTAPIHDVNIRKVMSDLMSGKTQDMHPEHKSMMDVWIA